MTLASLLPSTAAWTGVRYGRFRLVLGAYLAVHFVHLAPWAAEIFSSQGVLPEASASPFVRLFPNVLALVDGPVFVTALVAVAAVAAVLLALGVGDRLCALVLAYLLACLYGRNPLIANPSLPFVGWLLLAHAAVRPLPTGVGLWRGEPAGGYQLSRAMQTAAWIVLACGYTFSGYTKLMSPSWLDGTAVARVLASPLARPGWLRDSLLGLPAGVHHVASWAALGLELAFLPLAIVPALRRWVWAAMVGMHLSLIALVAFADLSFGMIVFHLFVADPAWTPAPLAHGVERLSQSRYAGLPSSTENARISGTS
jgi:hypothetical protein